MEQKKIVQAENSLFDFTQALSKVKMSVPLLEMMKIKEYRDSAIQLISNGTNKKKAWKIEKLLKLVITSKER